MKTKAVLGAIVTCAILAVTLLCWRMGETAVGGPVILSQSRVIRQGSTYLDITVTNPTRRDFMLQIFSDFYSEITTDSEITNLYLLPGDGTGLSCRLPSSQESKPIYIACVPETRQQARGLSGLMEVLGLRPKRVVIFNPRARYILSTNLSALSKPPRASPL